MLYSVFLQVDCQAEVAQGGDLKLPLWDEVAGDQSPGSTSPKLPQEKSGQKLAVPSRCEDDSSSSNSSPTPRKLRSKLCPLAFGYANDLLLQQSDVTASGFWGRALGGNDVAAKKSDLDAGGT